MTRPFAIPLAATLAACAAERAPAPEPAPPPPALSERPLSAPPPERPWDVTAVRGHVPEPRDDRPTFESGITYNPFTRLVEGGDEHSFTTGRWQFADRPQADRRRDGPDFRLDRIHYVNFDTRRTMWGQDGRISFRRLYDFDPEAKTVTFTLDRSRCEDDCTDTGAELGNAWREVPTRFLGIYQYTVNGRPDVEFHDPQHPELVLTKGDEVIRLEAFREPDDLPAIPSDQPLCEVRDANGQTVLGGPQFKTNAFGQQLTGPDTAFMFDHANPLDPTVYVEFLGAAPVRYDAPGVSQTIRRVTAYPTVLVLTLDGAYCRPTGQYRDGGRVWYDFPARTPESDPEFGPSEEARLEFTAGTCFAAIRADGSPIFPVFPKGGAPRADDFGSFVAQDGTRKRFGDAVRLRVGRRLSDSEREPGDVYLNGCGWPMHWVVAD